MVGQIGLFEEARVKIEAPEPMTAVRVGSRVARIPLQGSCSTLDGNTH